MTDLPAQLRLIGMEVTEQDPSLPLADVQPGEIPQSLRVIAPIADRDVDPELVRTRADRLHREFVDGEAEFVEAADGPLDAVAVREAEYRFGVQCLPQRVVPNLDVFGLGDQRVLQLLRAIESFG